jgi:hypothetical protein
MSEMETWKDIDALWRELLNKESITKQSLFSSERRCFVRLDSYQLLISAQLHVQASN